MARRTVAPQLADITQDIAGEIPVSVVLGWATGEKTAKRHKKMLAPYTVQATVVSSDSAGLSKLSQKRRLLEVMKLVSDPKEVIYAYGTHIGGKAIGTWAADNTEMLYPADISVADVVGQMMAAQQELRSLPVKVGLCIHHGEFIHIGGGLFGKDADMVEAIAERYTEGGDILLTSQAHTRVSPALQQSAVKLFIDKLRIPTYKLTNHTPISHKGKSTDTRYPLPFSEDFFRLLTQFDKLKPQVIKSVYLRYAKEKVVVLIKIHHRLHRFLLDQFAHWILANAVFQTDASAYGMERIKSNGSLGIFVTDDIQNACSFAKNLHRKLGENGYRASIGIARGEVLIFPMSDGAKDIAGNPVNVASKLAEDGDTEDNIWIESSAMPRTKKLAGEPFTTTISHVQLQGIVIRPH